MHQPPVIDLLFKAIVTGNLEAIDEVQTNRAHECADIRALICMDRPGAIPLNLGLGLESSIYVTPFFEGPSAFFISKHTSVQSRISQDRSNVLLDYSLSFDSNFAEKLRATIAGEEIQAADKNRVMDVLQLKARNPRVQFDVVPFLYENIRFARESEVNLRPVDTLIAFRMLDHLDWDAFRKTSESLRFAMDRDALAEALRPDAASFLESQYKNPAVLHHEAKSVGVQALLLRLASLWHAGRPNPEKILRELIDFSIFELGALPRTELGLIWSGISTKDPAPFFGPITGKAKSMLKKIRGMAWDMTHLRLLEQTASLSKLGSFFVPHFVSIDERWRNLLRLNPVRLMLADDSQRAILFARTNEESVQRMFNECMSEQAKKEFTPSRIAARRAAGKNLRLEAMRSLVDREERAWL
jgi:hypothetical protein